MGFEDVGWGRCFNLRMLAGDCRHAKFLPDFPTKNKIFFRGQLAQKLFFIDIFFGGVFGEISVEIRQGKSIKKPIQGAISASKVP